MTDTFELDVYDYAFHEDPYPTYRRLRQEAPLHHSVGGGFWALSHHADVVAAFRDSDRFSSAQGVSLDPAASGPEAHRTSSFLAMDPPMHGRMRGLVSRGFTPRRVAAMEPRIRQLAVEHLEVALAADDLDLIADFAGLVPMDVISEMMGVPAADRVELRRLADLLVHREEGVRDVPPAGIEAFFALTAYYAAMIAERRQHPGDDLTSALLAAEVEGDRLSDEEVASFMFLMVVAGNETTTKLLGNAWYWAWRHPDQQALALSGPEAVPAWVEETLRFDTSSQVLARTTTEDVDIAGGTIPAGERVVLLVGSANRDERAFDDPDRYDLQRPGLLTPGGLPGLASFGFGRHFCLGASLARLEARVCLEEVAKRIRSFEVDPDGVARVHSVSVRGFSALPSTVTLR